VPALRAIAEQRIAAPEKRPG
jgi:hypothetical protein